MKESSRAKKLIIVISGKRKSGKDFITEKIIAKLGNENCFVMRVAGPIKKHFCELYGMDYQKMLTSANYKETIREEMILWGEEQRKNNAYVFCEIVKQEALESNKPVWILSDARRQADVEYFFNFGKEQSIRFYSVRVEADNESRKQRGWVYTKGVDDVTSECGLDHYKNWDFIFQNSKGDDITEIMEQFTKLCQEDLA